MTTAPIDFVVLKEDKHNPFRILEAVHTLRKELDEQNFKSDIESIYLLGCLLDTTEDSALIAILER